MSVSSAATNPRDPAGLISVEDARSFLLERARPVAELEEVPLARAFGRVLARGQRAAIDVPGFDNSAMDGYAVRTADVAAAGETRLRVVQRIAAGGVGRTLEAGEAARIFTGAPIPQGADAVFIQEDCTREGEYVVVRGPAKRYSHIRPRGNDIAAGSEVLTAGVRLRPQEVGLAASVGLASLPVVRRLRVAIFSSGDELRIPGEPLEPGQIYNSNRFTLLGLLQRLGCETLDLGTVADTLEATRDALAAATRDTDLVVTSGGVSVGEEDHVKRALESLGRLDLWRVAVKPGKPLAYGRIGETDFLGLPGNPVSTLLTFCLFARPFILKRQGIADVLPRPMPVTAGFERPRPGRRREYLRARLEHGADGFVATIYSKQGSDVLTSATWADGLVEVVEGRPVARGDTLRYYSFADLID